LARKDWHQLDSTDDLAAVGISPHRGRGWRVLSGILFVGAATFAVAYHLPLYRAHAALSREYLTLSTQANTQHKQLTETLDTLKQISTERDRLNETASKLQKSSDTLAPQAETLERSLQAPLKKYLGPGKAQLSRQKEKVQLALANPALVASTGADLTDAGKKTLCLLGGTLKSADVHIVVHGYGSPSLPKKTAVWQIPALRASNAAQLLSESCGLDASRIEVSVGSSSPSPQGVAIQLEITPR
jgi:flagellar motor protein MotB